MKQIDHYFDELAYDVCIQEAEVVEQVTREQFRTLLKELIASGDIMRHTTQDHFLAQDGVVRQSITYIPFAQVQRLNCEINELKDTIIQLRARIEELEDETD